jgi:hypothetical protein
MGWALEGSCSQARANQNEFVPTKGAILDGNSSQRGYNFSKMMFEAAYGKEMNIQFSSNCSGGPSCSQHDNCTLPQLETSVPFSGFLLSPA